MDVVQVSWHRDAGGRTPAELLDAWPTLSTTAAAAARAGANVTVVQAAREDAIVEYDGARIEFVRTRDQPTVRNLLGPWAAPIDDGMLERIAAHRPDVVHQHGLTHPLHARALTTRLPDTPVLVQDHASRPSRRGSRMHRWGLAHVAAVGFTARAQAEPFFEAGALPSGVRVVELLESSSRFTPGDRAAARQLTGLAGEPCLLWIANLDENKDPLTVIDAFAATASLLPHARLWMAYIGAPLLDAVRARIELNPVLQERVTLLGAQPHERIEPLLRAADFLVQASRFEGSGYAVIEALACGTTPLVTDIPSFRRITGDGKVGGLFQPGDSAELGRLLLHHAVRPGEPDRAAARAHFEAALSFDVLGAELTTAYASLLEQRP